MPVNECICKRRDYSTNSDDEGRGDALSRVTSSHGTRVVGNVRVAPEASKAMRPACILDKRNRRFEALMNHFRWQPSLRKFCRNENDRSLEDNAAPMHEDVAPVLALLDVIVGNSDVGSRFAAHLSLLSPLVHRRRLQTNDDIFPYIQCCTCCYDRNLFLTHHNGGGDPVPSRVDDVTLMFLTS
jgi:hypothetical protein